MFHNDLIKSSLDLEVNKDWEDNIRYKGYI